MDGKPPLFQTVDEGQWWCHACKEYVGRELELAHIWPVKYPGAKECDKCDPTHFFYFSRCPKCHGGAITGKAKYDSFLPLADGEEIGECVSCGEELTRLKHNPKYKTWLCMKCFGKPRWEDDE